MQDKLFLAWVAGFFDGEGCVLVSHRDNHTTYQLAVSVTQQDPTPLHMIKDRFGGNVTADKTATLGYERKKGRVLVWRWKSSSKVAHDFLQAIQPYVVVKKDQVNRALMWPTPGKLYSKTVLMPDKVRQERKQIMYDLQELKKVYKILIEESYAQ